MREDSIRDTEMVVQVAHGPDKTGSSLPEDSRIDSEEFAGEISKLVFTGLKK